MDIRLALGAEVDVVSSKELDAGLDSLGDKILGKQRALPIYSFRTQSDVMPVGGGALVLDLGCPPTGRMWNIMAVTTFGSDDATVVANAKVALYCGDASNPSLVSLKIPAMIVPSFQSVTQKVLWCLDRESLFARVTGAAVAAQVGVVVTIAEWKECDVVAGSGR